MHLCESLKCSKRVGLKIDFNGIADKPHGLFMRGWCADLFYRFLLYIKEILCKKVIVGLSRFKIALQSE